MVCKRLDGKQGFVCFWLGKGKGFERQLEEVILILIVIVWCFQDIDGGWDVLWFYIFFVIRWQLQYNDGLVCSFFEERFECLFFDCRDVFWYIVGGRGFQREIVKFIFFVYLNFRQLGRRIQMFFGVVFYSFFQNRVVLFILFFNERDIEIK